MMTERELSRRARHRLAVLRHVEEVSGSVAATGRYYGISRQCSYIWLRRVLRGRRTGGLRDRSSTPHRTAPHHTPHATKADIVEKILWLRQQYHFGPAKIAMYLQRRSTCANPSPARSNCRRHRRLARMRGPGARASWSARATTARKWPYTGNGSPTRSRTSTLGSPAGSDHGGCSSTARRGCSPSSMSTCRRPPRECSAGAEWRCSPVPRWRRPPGTEST